MALTDTDTVDRYSCDGVTTSFQITFPFNDNNDIQVWVLNTSTRLESQLTYVTDYTIDADGNVVTDATWAAGITLVIKRVLPLKQETERIPRGPLSAQTIDLNLDELTMMVQQHEEMLSRAALLKTTSTYSELELPDPEEGKHLRWESGELVNATYYGSGWLDLKSFMQVFLQSATKEAARDNLGYYEFIQDDDFDTYITTEKTANENKIRVYTAGSLSLTINETGKVCVGSSSPIDTLDISGRVNIGATNQIYRADLDTDDAALRLNYVGYNGGTTRFRDLKIYDGKNNVVVMVDGSAGYVGIGKSSPGYPLHLATSGFTRSLIEGTTPDLSFYETDGNANENFDIRVESGVLKIGTNNDAFGSFSSKMSVAQNGYVGIGTANPAEKLNVYGNGAHVTSKISVSSSGYIPMLNLAQVGAVGWNVYLETTSGDFMIGINTGQTAIDIVRTGSNIQYVNFPNGKLGIGTDTVPHGGVGGAKVALEGNNANLSLGPHIQITTVNNDYPLIQWLNWSHDNIQIVFDAYYGGGADRSSDAGSNFRIWKCQDKLRIQRNSGTAAGSSFSWSHGITLTADGKVGIAADGPSGVFEVYPDTDQYAIIGRAYAGYCGLSDYAAFGHIDLRTTASYALLQYCDGTTYLNTASGKQMYICRAGTNIWQFTSANHLIPAIGVGTQDIGSAANYIGDLNYKELIDRGCLGSFDEGVELSDGSLVSYIEALKAIQIEKDDFGESVFTVYGVPKYDYATMPKAVYKPALIADEDFEDETGKRWEKGEKMGVDGAEITALISIMIGAIKLLNDEIEELKKERIAS